MTSNSGKQAAAPIAGDVTHGDAGDSGTEQVKGLAALALGDARRTEEAANLENVQKVEAQDGVGTTLDALGDDRGGGAGQSEDTLERIDPGEGKAKGETPRQSLVGDNSGAATAKGVNSPRELSNPTDELFEVSNEKYVASVQQLASRKEDEVMRTAEIISRPSLACEEVDCIGEAILKAEVFVKPRSEELKREKIESEASLKLLRESSAQQQSSISDSLESESLTVENALKDAESLQSEAINATLEAIDNLEESRILAKDSTRLELNNALAESSRLDDLKRKEATKGKLDAILSKLESGSEQQDPVFSSDSWANAGYTIHSPLDAEKSLEAIQNIPLHTYLLRDDSKVDVMVRSNRRHVGVIDSEGASLWIPESDDSGSIDASTVFAYNLKALSQLVGNIDSFGTKLQTLANVPRKSTFGTRISEISEIVAPTEVVSEGSESSKKWKSSAQLASETTALEAEASVSEMKLMAQQFKAVTKAYVSGSKHNSRMTVLQETDVSTARSVETAKVVENLRDTEIAFTGSLLDTAIHQITTTGKVISMKNDTFRELLRLREASMGEAERARERILSEAKLERETETTSVIRIRVVGEEATKATIEIIKVTFQNVAEAVHHTFKTEQGRKQIAVFILGACLLAFCIVLSREVFVLGFSMIRKELMTPKLVREYGRSRRRTSASTILGNAGICLAKDVEERVENICTGTALARERGAPLRHVLVYGRPALDEAILDRMDELVELELPSRKERRRILEHSFSKRFRVPGAERRGWMRVPWMTAARDSRLLAETSFELERSLDRLSADNMTQGCSGRELDKMLQSVITNVYTTNTSNFLATSPLYALTQQHPFLVEGIAVAEERGSAIAFKINPCGQASEKRGSPLPHDGNWLTGSAAAWPDLNAAASGWVMDFEKDPFFTKGWPMGSIFYHYSEEEAEERRRLRNKKCPEDATTYYSRARHFKEVQDRRQFVPPNAFYKLLKKNAQTADNLERQARIQQAGQMFLKHAMGALRSKFTEWKELAAKSKRARRFLKRKFWGIQRSVLVAWCKVAQKNKRGRLFLAKHMGSIERKSFVAWKEYTRKCMKVKKFLKGHMSKLEQTVFEAWANHVRKGKYVRGKMSKHLVGAKRERFTRWANYARTSAKIKALVGKHFVGVVRTTFEAWYQWVGKMIKAKRMFASQLVAHVLIIISFKKTEGVIIIIVIINNIQ
ncbi:hypothetical protein TL16_g00168 [Triparma laevis f. inornata]|uniref:Transmembrane protein n=1 Tax=Triparma laevis f. inornata TaxID=1714386 RepID=A0A9W6ZC51_9STRA|nr:hypothetical protein TL16_g00168 [Triparma laevis f. inornata]